VTAPAPTPRTSLTNVDGTIKKGTGSLAAICFGVLLVAFAAAKMFIAYKQNTHTNVDDYIVAGCLIVAFICVLPARFEDAVAVLKPVLPWIKKGDDR
jgi:hypothetical protein